jgi:hypothetical protein
LTDLIRELDPDFEFNLDDNVDVDQAMPEGGGGWSSLIVYLCVKSIVI